MKKLLITAVFAALAAVSARADFFWSTWDREDIRDKDVTGCVLGLSSKVKAMTGAQISLLFNDAEEVRAGAQGTLFMNATDTLRNGVQLGLVNQAKSAALQLGLVCFNDTGFLPIFVLINFDVKKFGKK